MLQFALTPNSVVKEEEQYRNINIGTVHASTMNIFCMPCQHVMPSPFVRSNVAEKMKRKVWSQFERSLSFKLLGKFKINITNMTVFAFV